MTYLCAFKLVLKDPDFGVGEGGNLSHDLGIEADSVMVADASRSDLADNWVVKIDESDSAGGRRRHDGGMQRVVGGERRVVNNNS